MLDKCRCNTYKIDKGLKFIKFLCAFLKTSLDKKEMCSITFTFNLSQGAITALEYSKKDRITAKELSATCKR